MKTALSGISQFNGGRNRTRLASTIARRRRRRTAKKRVATSVCKHRFEPRDPNWAPEAEQRVRDFVADTGLLRLPDEDDPAHHLECREELRLTLVFGGLLEEDSVVDVIVFEPADREQDSFPDINDLCAAQ